jgi:hypothetical protein
MEWDVKAKDTTTRRFTGIVGLLSTFVSGNIKCSGYTVRLEMQNVEVLGQKPLLNASVNGSVCLVLLIMFNSLLKSIIDVAQHDPSEVPLIIATTDQVNS